MKTITLQKRIQKLDLNKSSLVLKMLNNLSTNEKIRPIYSQGSSWNHSSLVDKSQELKAALRLLKLKFEEDNDAPRGGKTGYFIKITTKII